MSADGDVMYQLYIGGEIDDDVAGEIITQMAEFDDADPTAFWNVVINCSGGTTESGSAVAMRLRSYSERGGGSHYVKTIATGRCASMATLIAQQGDWRITDRLCVWLFHEPSTGVFEMTLSNVRADMDMLQKWNDIADEMVVERTNLSVKEYQSKIEGRNWFAMSDELFELNFVDEVLDLA